MNQIEVFYDEDASTFNDKEVLKSSLNYSLFQIVQIILNAKHIWGCITKLITLDAYLAM